eukprot:TRINITY_DN16616_c0_g1_i1.p1 TRINITY_DN16616_c0_g1~~TRINITY_DN16616_c0_g1_i1.p1  ORF type:complete len:631 (+),score=216.56 TRINITY_DN16616_c0_g1_i1:42-1934(+)
MALLAELSAAAGRLGCPPADGGERHVRSAAGGGARGRRGGSDAPLWAQRVLRNTAARASARRHVVGPVSPRVTAAPRQRRCRGWYDEGRKMCLMFAGANEDAAALRAASQRSAVAAAHRAVRRPRDTSESPELLEGVDDEGGGGEELQEADGDAEARTPSAAESEPPPASPHSAAVVQTVDAWVSSLEGSAEVPPGSAVRLAVLREELFSVLEQEAESRADREELASELSAVQRRLAGVVRERERGIAQQLFSGRRPRVRRPSSVGRASAAASALEQSAARTDAQSRAAKSTIAPSAHPAAAEPPPEAAKEAGEKKEEEAGREDKKKDGGKPRWQAARPRPEGGMFADPWAVLPRTLRDGLQDTADLTFKPAISASAKAFRETPAEYSKIHPQLYTNALKWKEQVQQKVNRKAKEVRDAREAAIKTECGEFTPAINERSRKIADRARTSEPLRAAVSPSRKALESLLPPKESASADVGVVNVSGEVVSVSHLLVDDDGAALFPVSSERHFTTRPPPQRRWTLPHGGEAQAAAPAAAAPAMPSQPPAQAASAPAKPKQQRPKKQAPAPVIGVAVLCVPPAQLGVDKPMPGVISEVGQDTVRIEFADKRNLGRQDVPLQHYLDHAQPAPKKK